MYAPLAIVVPRPSMLLRVLNVYADAACYIWSDARHDAEEAR